MKADDSKAPRSTANLRTCLQLAVVGPWNSRLAFQGPIRWEWQHTSFQLAASTPIVSEGSPSSLETSPPRKSLEKPSLVALASHPTLHTRPYPDKAPGEAGVHQSVTRQQASPTQTKPALWAYISRLLHSSFQPHECLTEVIRHPYPPIHHPQLPMHIVRK